MLVRSQPSLICEEEKCAVLKKVKTNNNKKKKETFKLVHERKQKICEESVH